MADPALSAASPLAGLFLPSAEGLVRVSEATPSARFSLRVREENSAALSAALNLTLPERINTAAETRARAALRLGPDEWLILAEPGEPRVLFDAAARLDRAVPHALVEISDRNAGLVLAGPAVESVLASACPLPLDLARFPVGRATRTLFAKAEIVLWRRANAEFRIELARSFVPYVVGLLAEVIRQEAAMLRVGSDPLGLTLT